MPVGQVFRDKPKFGGNPEHQYHRGTESDPIPIIWYKNPMSYPSLRIKIPMTANSITVNFGESFTVGGIQFGLNSENKPSIGWKIRKVAHHDLREGQKSYNEILNCGNVEVFKNGEWRTPPLGDKHQFDGDHVKDLGFGGGDSPGNYWPLDSTINRRAFTGYNAGYVLHYIDGEEKLKSRAIGGLVGKWFKVKGFLSDDAGAVPNESEKAGTDSV